MAQVLLELAPGTLNCDDASLDVDLDCTAKILLVHGLSVSFKLLQSPPIFSTAQGWW